MLDLTRERGRQVEGKIGASLTETICWKVSELTIFVTVENVKYLAAVVNLDWLWPGKTWCGNRLIQLSISN